jgi:hypothetical protein
MFSDRPSRRIRCFCFLDEDVLARALFGRDSYYARVVPFHRSNESISSFRHRLDPGGCFGRLTEHFSQQENVSGEITLLNERVGPNLLQQLVFGYELPSLSTSAMRTSAAFGGRGTCSASRKRRRESEWIENRPNLYLAMAMRTGAYLISE